jgi:hypothetical protein
MRATLGELLAWIIGWDLVLEYAVGRPSQRLVRVGVLRHSGVTFYDGLGPVCA